MISKQQLVDSLYHECDVTLHLFEKLAPEAYEYRPSSTQRSTLDLLRYLSICGIAGTTCMAEKNWKLWGERFTPRAKEMPAADFPGMMVRQKQELGQLFAAIDDERLRTQESPMPGGRGTMPLAAAIMNFPLKWLAAYKMQLFLYAKGNGSSQLATSNVWWGMDPVVK